MIVVNGRFMEDRMKGLVRYARELLDAMDPLADGNTDIVLLIPPTAHDVPGYKNIRVVQAGTKGGVLWEQTTLRKYVRKHPDSICLNLCNVTPLFVRPGATAILDIMYKVNPSHFTTFRNRLSRAWHCLQYSYIMGHEQKIITISDFCKREIEKHYPRAAGKIEVIPCAWQHVREYAESSDWQERYPFLEDGRYFFSLATLAKNKNGGWIIEAARTNPGETFVMAGGRYETEYSEIPDNVHLLGYISDEDACALIKHCKAFIFPSVYEGFGLPPLEALALGAEVISSDRASLPEVLGSSVHYIDPMDTDVDIDALIREETQSADAALSRYSWETSAAKLLELLHTVQ